MDGELPQLTTGILNDIASSTNPEDPVWSTSPVLQFVQARSVGVGEQARWRTVISDGVHVMQAMVVTQLNHMFENGELGKGGIARVERFATNKLQDKR